MCMGTLVALAVSLGNPVAMPDGIPQHTQDNIRWSVGSAEIAALVTVGEAAKGSATVPMQVAEMVMGDVRKGEVLDVARARFAAQDLAPGKVLLVFLNRSGATFSSTGRYELEIDGTIRDLPTAKYLAATRSLVGTKHKLHEAPRLLPKVQAAVPSAGAVPGT